MDKQYHNCWDNGVYGTGPIRPKKDRHLLLAVLLILVIFLMGIVSLLGILNVRLFQKLQERPQTQELPIPFAAEAAETAQSEPVQAEVSQPLPTEAPVLPTAEATVRTDTSEVTLNLQESPASAENIPQSGGLSLQEIYTRCINSVVSVTCVFRNGSSYGTGVIFSADGYVVTNYHVIEGAETISLLLTDGRELNAVVVGCDSVSDLAVLRMEGNDFLPAEFGDSEALRVGDSVAAIGDPLGSRFRGTMTNGIVSAINRNVAVSGIPMNLIQTNAALNTGNSGGPLINCHGQVIGINTMKIGGITDNTSVEGLGFAIPSATVKRVVEELITQGYVSGRPLLGIEGEQLSGFYQHYYNMPNGLIITAIEAGSPAELAGLQLSDILMTVDGTEIHDMNHLSSLLYGHKVGDTLRLGIYRSGTVGTVSVTLAEAKGS